ncbi:MAG: cation diffusion facilitator family transporter [Anaerolineae bacterium]
MDRTLERMGVYSLVINMGLVALKLGLAAFSGSLALAASATDSAVDIFGSLAVLVGLVISKRKTRAFPFGLYKVENVVSIIIAVLILVAGYEIAKEAIAGSTGPVTTEWWMLLAVGLTVIVPLVWSRYELRVGKSANSPSLIAEARHYQMDVLSSSIVFASVVASGLGLALDRVGALLIVPFIAKSGWDLMADGMKVLLDASLDAETLGQVRTIIESFPGVKEVKSVVGRNSGRYRFLQADIVVRTSDLDKAHRLSEQLDQAIRDGVSNVERVVIHYEPQLKSSLSYGVPLSDPKGTVSEHLGKAAYFALVELKVDDASLVRQEIVVNPYQALEKQKGLQVARMLVEQGVDVLLVREDLEGKGPSYVLADGGVETRITRAGTLSEVMSELGTSAALSLTGG